MKASLVLLGAGGYLYVSMLSREAGESAASDEDDDDAEDEEVTKRKVTAIVKARKAKSSQARVCRRVARARRVC